VIRDYARNVGAAGVPDRSRAGPSPAWETEQIERARRDPAAFAPLYEAYAEVVWRYALSRLADRERAADVTSQTFAKALAALPGYRPERRGERTTFRSWLMTIARNTVIDEVRRTPVTATIDASTVRPRLIATERSPEEEAIAASERERIERALSQLPETQRQIVELRALGMTGAEIAGVLRMSIGAVKTANHRAYRRLRELLDDRCPRPEMDR
jgi:RNA polymerase sigma-70 factor (ECF subfamily)